MQPLFLPSVSNKAWINRKYSCTLLSCVPVTLGPFFAPSLSPGTSLLGRTKKTTQFSPSPVYSTASPTCQSNTWQQLKRGEWKERGRERKKKRCETRKQIGTNAVRGVPQPSRRGAKSHDSWQSGHAVPLSGP